VAGGGAALSRLQTDLPWVLSSARSATASGNDLNSLQRRIRTRVSGGVGGVLIAAPESPCMDGDATDPKATTLAPRYAVDCRQ
jgi:hypothetical protein